MWLTFLLACSEFGLDPIGDASPPPRRVAVVDPFVQAPLPKVDLLLVVDNTASMAREQDALALVFPRLADLLEQAGVAWQVGVVTTDMTSPDAGMLTGSPWVLTPGLVNAPAAFAQAIRVGTAGQPPEAGLAAAMRALELSMAGQVNAGFRRPDAALHVVLVSDADDASDAFLDDPAGSFVSALEEDSLRTGLPAIASAVVGDLPSGCISPFGAAKAANRYHRVVNQTGGVALSICDVTLPDLVEALIDTSLAYPTRFELRATPLDGNSLRVLVADEQVNDWLLELDPIPAVVFDAPPPPGVRIEVRYIVEVAG